MLYSFSLFAIREKLGTDPRRQQEGGYNPVRAFRDEASLVATGIANRFG